MLCQTVHHHRDLTVTLTQQLNRKADAWAAAMANIWETELRRTGPEDTGQLIANTVGTAQGHTATVTIDTPYAHMVAYGARPHTITARPGGYLVFPNTAGEIIYRKSVEHPGQQPNPWWTNAIDRVPEMSQRAWNSLP